MDLLKKNRIALLEKKEKSLEEIISFLNETSVSPEQINVFLADNKTAEIKQKQKAITLALRPQINIEDLIRKTTRREEVIKEVS